MCFSAEASVAAAVVLGTAGGYTIKNCQSKYLLFLAATPLLFGLQQLTESIIWLYFDNHLASNFLLTTSTKLFLVFAFLIWPIWIPLSLGFAEKITWRRTVIMLDLACGVILSALNLSYALTQEVIVEVVNHSIQYKGDVPSQAFIYPLIVLIPCFLSSLKNMWIFGLLTTFAYIGAYYFYATTFVSVWCFFAAIISLVIYRVIKDNQMSVEEPESRNSIP